MNETAEARVETTEAQLAETSPVKLDDFYPKSEEKPSARWRGVVKAKRRPEKAPAKINDAVEALNGASVKEIADRCGETVDRVKEHVEFWTVNIYTDSCKKYRGNEERILRVTKIGEDLLYHFEF